MTSGFAPGGEVLTVVEQKVVVLFANPAHRSSQGYTSARLPGMVDDGRLIPLGELLHRAAQDFPSFQVMGNAPIAKVDAMVIKQAVLTRNLQMVASAQCDSKILRLSLLLWIPQQFSEIEFFGCNLLVDRYLLANALIKLDES